MFIGFLDPENMEIDTKIMQIGALKVELDAKT